MRESEIRDHRGQERGGAVPTHPMPHRHRFDLYPIICTPMMSQGHAVSHTASDRKCEIVPGVSEF